MAELAPSTLIDGRFLLEAERKRGGMGIVWRARELHGGRPVALKLLHGGEIEQVERFARECALLAGLSHRAIVSYIAHGTAPGGVPYLAMEWLDGETVAERLARERSACTRAWGWCTARAANRVQARRMLDRVASIELGKGDGDMFARGHAYYWQMRYEELLGDDPYATYELACRAAEYNERAGNRRMLAVALVEVGECARRVFSLAEGEDTLRRAVKLAREVAEPISAAFVQQYLANFLAEHGAVANLDEAQALGAGVLALAGDGAAYRALGLCALSSVALRRGDLDAAERDARAARDIVQSIRLCSYFPHADSALLRALLARGEHERAAELADAALGTLDALAPLGIIELEARLWVARAHRARGREADAARGVRAALARLARRAARVPTLALREAFLMRVPEHAALAALGRELGVSEA